VSPYTELDFIFSPLPSLPSYPPSLYTLPPFIPLPPVMYRLLSEKVYLQWQLPVWKGQANTAAVSEYTYELRVGTFPPALQACIRCCYSL